MLVDAVSMIHATPPEQRSRFAKEIWRKRRAHGTDSGGVVLIPKTGDPAKAIPRFLLNHGSCPDIYIIASQTVANQRIHGTTHQQLLIGKVLLQ